MRVLLVEDDVMVGKALVQALEGAANATDWVRDGARALEALAGGDHDVVLLDVGLPDRSGFSILDALRGGGNDVPILLITARDALEDRIHGLDLGADDYLVKPFDPDELMARMRATVRRRFGVTQSVLETADLRLNLASHELTYKGRSCLLPGREFDLMRVLMERAGTILSRPQLERLLYGPDAQIESNSIDVLIYSIRRRFDKGIMRNVRGAGWMVRKRRA